MRDLLFTVPGLEICGIWLEAPLETRLKRVAGRHGDASDADVEVARSQHGPGDLGTRWHRVDAGRSVEEVTGDILRLLPPAGA